MCAPPHYVADESIAGLVKPIIRIATEQDILMEETNRELEKEALEIAKKKVQEHELDMNITSAEYSLYATKITFYFTADGRVDFRELVKDLASIFKTRIELRQIGVRDVARMIGGLGSCGRPVCCKSFLEDFQPVSIKMAKVQGLSLNPTKISGICGRLMCCLQYEQCSYEEARKLMPHVGAEVETIDGPGVVVENNLISEKSKVKVTMHDGTPEVREYSYRDIRVVKHE